MRKFEIKILILNRTFKFLETKYHKFYIQEKFGTVCRIAIRNWGLLLAQSDAVTWCSILELKRGYFTLNTGSFIHIFFSHVKRERDYQIRSRKQFSFAPFQRRKASELRTYQYYIAVFDSISRDGVAFLLESELYLQLKLIGNNNKLLCVLY